MKSKETKSKAKKYHAQIIIGILAAIFVFSYVYYVLMLNGFQGDFSKNLRLLEEANAKYNTTLYTFPLTIDEDRLLLGDLDKLKSADSKEPFKLLLEFRAKLVESDIFSKEGWKYGKASTTKYGFGCKSIERIRNSTYNRNVSAQIGFEALDITEELIEKYPKEAQIANLDQQRLLFLNQTFSQEQKSARRDRSIVENACKKE